MCIFLLFSKQLFLETCIYFLTLKTIFLKITLRIHISETVHIKQILLLFLLFKNQKLVLKRAAKHTLIFNFNLHEFQWGVIL